MKTFFTNITRLCKRAVHYLFPITADSINIFLPAAIYYDYKVTVKELFYPNFISSFDDGLSATRYCGGSYCLRLRGIKEGHYDLVCTVPLAHTINNDLNIFSYIEEQKQKILYTLKSFNLLSEG